MNGKTPHLSIIVPVRNGIKYLESTLESLVAIGETMDTEVIFQDCLSRDGTTELIRGYCEKYSDWRHFVEPDRGQSDAINRGVERSSGRWITWLCADDILFSGIAGAIEQAERVGADVVYGDVVFLTQTGITPAIGTETCEKKNLAKSRLIIQQPGTCILRNTWQKSGGVNTELNWSMDYDLFMRLELHNAKFHRARTFVACARLHPEAKTSSGSIKRLLELWSILLKIHSKSLASFRLKPYLVYFLEFVIRKIESYRFDTVAIRFLIGKLHVMFWKVARPRENADIMKRFLRMRSYFATRCSP